MKYDIYFGNGNVRFALGRSGETPLVVIGINPSTADSYKADPTIRKVEKLVSGWKYHGFLMLNLYPVRESSPEKICAGVNPELALINSKIIGMLFQEFKQPTIWAAWGDAIDLSRDFVVCLDDLVTTLKIQNADWLQCGNLTEKKNPRHPNPNESFDKTFRRGLQEFALKRYLREKLNARAFASLR